MENSLVEIIQNKINIIIASISTLLNKHSEYYLRDDPNQGLVRINQLGDMQAKIVSTNGERLRNQIQQDFESLITEIDPIFSNLGTEELSKYHSEKKGINDILNFEITTSNSSSDDINKIIKLFAHILFTIKTLDDESDKTPIVFPDTNALIKHNEIHKWSFKELKIFKIFLTPTVISEIGNIKDNPNKNRSARDKAKSIDNQLKEFQRRGNLINGVEIVKNKISLQAIPQKPNFKTLPISLDDKNNDDRILTTIHNIRSQFPFTPVFAISNDKNFQNKAALLQIPFLEPESF